VSRALGTPGVGDLLVHVSRALEGAANCPKDDVVASLNALSRERPRRFYKDAMEMAEEFRVLLEESIELVLEDMAAGKPVPARDEPPLGEVLRPEAQFVVWVWLPCWYETGQAAVHVLRRARQGDLAALEAILRIDKATVRDRRIAQRIHEAALTNRALFVRLGNAMRGGPVRRATRRKVKCTLAGLISNVSESLGRRLKEPKIRRLFDAIARDTGKGLTDRNLPASPEAFAKAIQRERAFWRVPGLPPVPDLREGAAS